MAGSEFEKYRKKSPIVRSAALLKEMPSSRPMAYALPGIEALVAALRAEPSMTVGLPTGNFPETGRLKIRAAGLDPAHFPVSVWGDDGTARRELPPVAMRRYQEVIGHIRHFAL